MQAEGKSGQRDLRAASCHQCPRYGAVLPPVWVPTAACCALIRALPLHVYGLIFSREGFLPGSLCLTCAQTSVPSIWASGFRPSLTPSVPWGEICLGGGVMWDIPLASPHLLSPQQQRVRGTARPETDANTVQLPRAVGPAQSAAWWRSCSGTPWIRLTASKVQPCVYRLGGRAATSPCFPQPCGGSLCRADVGTSQS